MGRSLWVCFCSSVSRFLSVAMDWLLWVDGCGSVAVSVGCFVSDGVAQSLWVGRSESVTVVRSLWISRSASVALCRLLGWSLWVGCWVIWLLCVRHCGSVAVSIGHCRTVPVDWPLWVGHCGSVAVGQSLWLAHVGGRRELQPQPTLTYPK